MDYLLYLRKKLFYFLRVIARCIFPIIALCKFGHRKLVFHRGPYEPPTRGGPFQNFLRKHIATCDFPGRLACQDMFLEHYNLVSIYCG